MPTKQLNTISKDGRFRVAKLKCENGCVCRMMEMGLMPGVQIRVVHQAPLGDPISVEFGGCHVSLRRRDAACVIVEEVA